METAVQSGIIAMAALLLGNVAVHADSLEPATSRYLQTIGAGFAMSPEDGVHYALTFEVREPFDRPVYVTMSMRIRPRSLAKQLERDYAIDIR